MSSLIDVLNFSGIVFALLCFIFIIKLYQIVRSQEIAWLLAATAYGFLLRIIQAILQILSIYTVPAFTFFWLLLFIAIYQIYKNSKDILKK